MSKENKVLSVALAAALVAGISGLSTEVKAEDMEKCYGVAKAGKNDCGNEAHACAGHSELDGDESEWIYTPEGLCDKLVGGSTES